GNLGSWGPESFNYPAGSGVLGYLWSSFTNLGVQNVVTILPLIQSFMASFVILEFACSRIEKSYVRITSLVITVVVTCAGLLIPLLSNYAHGEGLARQASIAFAALAF